MVEKVFLNRERPIPTTETTSAIRTDLASTSRNNPVSEQLPFWFWIRPKYFPKFTAIENCLLIKFNSPGVEQSPATYLKECITALTHYLVEDVPSRDLADLRIRNTENVEDKVIGISLRPRDQHKPHVVRAVLGRVILGLFRVTVYKSI